ncbi:MAG: type II toxin-antitoxin system PemK/MazF family toxin [Actinobacteria bacterium]|nr:MAG: type II toxin-antitoxin system PemK/MazF family toxin [Actinomycetota bacterium]
MRSLVPTRQPPAAPSPQRGAHTGVVTARPSRKPAVAYAPRDDGDTDPGEVVWTWVPYEDDPSQGKDRPVLVIGWDHDRLVAVPFTSKDHTVHPDNMAIGSGPWDPSGRRSYVKLDRLLLVDPAVVRREGGALDRHRFDEVVHRLTDIHRWS